MALNLWLASIKHDVTAVTGVQAPIHGGLGGNGVEPADVTSVTDLADRAAVATSVTAAESKALQLEPAWALDCTFVTSVTADSFNTEGNVGNDLLSGELLTAARAYHTHHFKCPHCIAAGRGAGYGKRCADGQALRNTYMEN